MKEKNTKIKNELLLLPNVGPAVLGDLHRLGIYSVSDFKGEDPEDLYKKLEKITGRHVDRCMLYVLRSLVYMENTGERDSKNVAWWYFKDLKQVDRIR